MQSYNIMHRHIRAPQKREQSYCSQKCYVGRVNFLVFFLAAATTTITATIINTIIPPPNKNREWFYYAYDVLDDDEERSRPRLWATAGKIRRSVILITKKPSLNGRRSVYLCIFVVKSIHNDFENHDPETKGRKYK